jgi:hypothetical protein
MERVSFPTLAPALALAPYGTCPGIAVLVGLTPGKCSSQYAVLKNNQNNQEQKHGIRRRQVIIWKELVN